MHGWDGADIADRINSKVGQSLPLQETSSMGLPEVIDRE